MSNDAVFVYGPQRNLDYTPVANVDAGELVKVADDGSDNVLWGVVNATGLEADEKGAADIIGVYRLNKEAGGGVVFAPAETGAWDDVADEAVVAATAGAWDIAVCLEAAADGDDFVLAMLLGAVAPLNP